MDKQTEHPRVQYLFPTVIHQTDVAEHQALNSDLLKVVAQTQAQEPNSKPQSWACDLYTTIGNPTALLRHPVFARLRTHIDEALRDYCRSFNYDLSQGTPRVHECWMNVYNSKHSQEIHLHRNSMISGIYYVQAPPGSGPTLFYSPMSDVMLEPRARDSNALNAKVSGFAPVAGRILLFRSSLRHSVMPGQFEGERVTIAFNAVM